MILLVDKFLIHIRQLLKRLITEAIHTAASVIRFLKNIEESND